jgi:hypothetical protein
MYARVPVIALGLSLSVFFAISYLLCMLFYILFPTSFANHAMLSLFLPWFDALTWLSFLVGLAASIVWAWYIALVLGPLYNFFAARVR